MTHDSLPPAGAAFGPAPPSPPVPERLPVAAWALAWSCLASQVLAWLDRGMRPDTEVGWALSMLLSAVVVGWFAAGVIAARTGRLVVAWLVLVLVLVGDGVTLVGHFGAGPTGWPALHFLASAAALISLMRFSASDYYRWQRSRPRTAGPSLAPMVVIAVVVGVLGASTAQAPGGNDGVRVRVGI